ncbi:MAG: serine protease [Lachnospiraceae bacterium]
MQEAGKKPNILIPGILLIILMIVVFALAKKQVREEDSTTGSDGSEEIPTFAVTVQTQYYAGQGVVYAKKENTAYILTTRHLMEGVETGDFCTVTLFDGTEKEAVLIYCSETADAAFLMLETEGNLEPVLCDRTQFDMLKEGDAVAAYSIADTTPVQTEGKILCSWVYLEDFALDMMLLKLDAEAGMSGCAILTEDGSFAGILCGVSENGEAAVLPFSVIESEWIMTGKERDS